MSRPMASPHFAKANCLRGLALHRRASCLGARGGASGVPLLAAAAARPNWRCSISSSGRRLQERSDATQGGSIGSTCSEFIVSQPKGCAALSEAQWSPQIRKVNSRYTLAIHPHREFHTSIHIIVIRTSPHSLDYSPHLDMPHLKTHRHRQPHTKSFSGIPSISPSTPQGIHANRKATSCCQQAPHRYQEQHSIARTTICKNHQMHGDAK